MEDNQLLNKNKKKSSRIWASTSHSRGNRLASTGRIVYRKESGMFADKCGDKVVVQYNNAAAEVSWPCRPPLITRLLSSCGNRFISVHRHFIRRDTDYTSAERTGCRGVILKDTAAQRVTSNVKFYYPFRKLSIRCVEYVGRKVLCVYLEIVQFYRSVLDFTKVIRFQDFVFFN